MTLQTPPPLKRKQLEEILDAVREVRVGVIGDFYLDAYWYADMNRAQLSRETPLYPRPVVRETYSPGGASNVAWNLADLGVKTTRAFSVFGADWRGEKLKSLLSGSGIDCRSVLTQSERITPMFGKVILTTDQATQEDARVDFVNTKPVCSELEVSLIGEIETALAELDALVIADYQDMGVLTIRVRGVLNEFARRKPNIPFIVDSRSLLSAYIPMIIKPNRLEAARCFFPQREPARITQAELIHGGQDWCQKSNRPAFITLGEQGCLFLDAAHNLLIPQVEVPPPLDTVGAGDTFLACLAACLAAGIPDVEAAQTANLAAAVSVQKQLVTGTASPAEILDIYDRFIAPII